MDRWINAQDNRGIDEWQTQIDGYMIDGRQIERQIDRKIENRQINIRQIVKQ